MNEAIDNGVIERLKEVMADKRYKSVRAYALAINVDPSQLAKVLNGDRPATDIIVDNIGKSLKVNQDWLLYGQGNKYGQGKAYSNDVSQSLTLEDSKPDPYRERYEEQLRETIALLKKTNEDLQRELKDARERAITITEMQNSISEIQNIKIEKRLNEIQASLATARSNQLALSAMMKAGHEVLFDYLATLKNVSLDDLSYEVGKNALLHLALYEKEGIQIRD